MEHKIVGSERKDHRTFPKTVVGITAQGGARKAVSIVDTEPTQGLRST